MERLSVVVLSYNRKDELRQTLNILRKQDHPDWELVVADNGSADGTLEMLAAEFPWVKLLALGENLGVESRRKGAEAASGTVVAMYDDDSAPGGCTDLSRIAAFFESHPEAGAISTRVRRTRPGFDETWGWERYAVGGNDTEGYEGLYIHGSGMAFRRSALLESDAFGNGLFWGDEEWEAALNLLSRGWRIYFLPSILTEHRASSLNRSKARYFRRTTRNHLLTILRYFPLHKRLEYSLKEFLYQSALGRKYVPSVIAGAWDSLRLAPAWRKLRRSVPPERQDYLRMVQCLRYPSPLAWFENQRSLRRYRGSVRFPS